MTDLLAELRRRLDVPASQVSDELLTHFLDVSMATLGPWLVPDAATTYPANVDEATIQLAVKLYDTSARGAASMDAAGDWMMPAPAATPGLIRAVFGALGPALRMAGVSV